jgi:hypothetical protein
MSAHQWDDFFKALDNRRADAAAAAFDHIVASRMRGKPVDCEPLVRIATSIDYSSTSDTRLISWSLFSIFTKAPIQASMFLEDLATRSEELRSAPDPARQALELVASALVSKCHGHSPCHWEPHQVGISAPLLPEDFERISTLRTLSRDETIHEHLIRGRDVLLYGDIGAGKTTTATRCIARWASDDHKVARFDLTDPYCCDESLAYALLDMDMAERVLLVLGDVHANLGAARAMFDFVVYMRREFRLPIVIMSTGTPIVNKVEPPLSSTRLEPVLADGRALIRSMIEGDTSLDQRDDVKKRISDYAGGDAYLAAIMLDFWHDQGRVPEEVELADFVAQRLGMDSLSYDARVLLFELACLSACEIAVGKRQIVLLPPERKALPDLIAEDIVKLGDDAYSIRNRSLARLIVVHGLRRWNGLDDLPKPAAFVYDYLQRAGEVQIRAALNKLDLSPFEASGRNRANGSFASAWRALDLLADSLAHRVAQDPTWSDEVASAAFAGMPLAKLGRHDAWLRCADFIRARWSYDSDVDLPVWVGEPSSDLLTFKQMSNLLEAQHGIGADYGTEASEAIDPERACRTWMLGLLLCFEALAPDPFREPDRIDALTRIADHVVDGGEFYPGQAPWVTAQVVQGLCLAGHSYQGRETVRRACDWLCQDRRVGGPYQAGWQNAVNVSTFDSAATALCFLALWQARCPHSEMLDMAYRRLCAEQQSLLSTPNRETEMTLLVEARLRHGDRWDDLSNPILHLLAWVRKREWSTRDVKATQPGDPVSASAKAPFIASHLWIIIWAAAKKELSRLIESILRLDDLIPPSTPWGPGDLPRQQTQTLADVSRGALISNDYNEESRKLARIRREVEQKLSTLAPVFDKVRLDSAQRSTKKEIDRWQAVLAEIVTLETAFDAGTATAETSRQIEELGRAVFGAAW